MDNKKQDDKYPRVLIVTLGRINAVDNTNNGLLLRNLFGQFPRENLAQIFSSGDNGDVGFFGRFYQLKSMDRRFGKLFYKLKSQSKSNNSIVNNNYNVNSNFQLHKLYEIGKDYLFNTGLYELIFCPHLSDDLLEWVRLFKPDLIFCQGYNLTFTWLPLMISKRFNLPIAYYPADDWPDYCYRQRSRIKAILSILVRYYVHKLSNRLVNEAKYCIAFSNDMKKEYIKRYKKEFSVLMQGDDIRRFSNSLSFEKIDEQINWLICTGSFDDSRLPLLEDVNKACEILNTKNINVRVKVFPVYHIPYSFTQNLSYVDFEECPSHDDLVKVLCRADILFLPERFGKYASRVRLSVSSKAHLYMYSKRPIIVYSDSITGIARYAESEKWALVVNNQDPVKLANAIELLLSDKELCEQLINRSQQIVLKNHDLRKIQNAFKELINTSIAD